MGAIRSSGEQRDRQYPRAPRPSPSSTTTATARRSASEPHPLPWPEGERYDPELLALGDRRNVGDAYRYWTREAIVADLDLRRHDFHVAVENWGHDFNIGSVVRTANAFLAKEIHIVGRRRWNRRGAMVTDRYQHVRHHPDTADLTAWAAAEGLPIIGIDNLPGAVPLERTELPRRCVLLFGQEGPGLTEEARKHASMVCSIAQFGSTRSINAGRGGDHRDARVGAALRRCPRPPGRPLATPGGAPRPPGSGWRRRPRRTGPRSRPGLPPEPWKSEKAAVWST
ncbi:tRNA (guanosine(18)-2'-O)-methyltransferase [Streptomyces microflavus]